MGAVKLTKPKSNALILKQTHLNKKPIHQFIIMYLPNGPVSFDG